MKQEALPQNSQEMIRLPLEELDRLTRLIITNPTLPYLLKEKEILCLIHIMRMQWTYKRRTVHTIQIVAAMKRNEESVCKYIRKIKARGLLTEEGMHDGHRTYELTPLFEYLKKLREEEADSKDE